MGYAQYYIWRGGFSNSNKNGKVEIGWIRYGLGQEIGFGENIRMTVENSLEYCDEEGQSPQGKIYIICWVST